MYYLNHFQSGLNKLGKNNNRNRKHSLKNNNLQNDECHSLKGIHNLEQRNDINIEDQLNQVLSEKSPKKEIKPIQKTNLKEQLDQVLSEKTCVEIVTEIKHENKNVKELLNLVLNEKSTSEMNKIQQTVINKAQVDDNQIKEQLNGILMPSAETKKNISQQLNHVLNQSIPETDINNIVSILYIKLLLFKILYH